MITRTRQLMLGGAGETLVGGVAVLIWGFALPVFRITEERIGVLAFIGAIYAGGGVLGLTRLSISKNFPSPNILRNPYLYGRWVFFVLHDVLIMSALYIVQKPNIPFVILLNYLWPTAIILCSVALGEVSVRRRAMFVAGTIVVIASLGAEALEPAALTARLFGTWADLMAYAMAFFGAISWGLYTALTRKAGEETSGGSVIPFFQLTLAAALPISFAPGLTHWSGLTGKWPWLLGVFCVLQFVANITWDFGARRGSIIILSLMADLIPWLSLAAASLLLGVSISSNTLVSAFTLVVGAICTRFSTTAATSHTPIAEAA